MIFQEVLYSRTRNENLEINPGLFDLGLNISFTPDTETLRDIKFAFERNRRHDPTKELYNILDCLIAFIDYRLPRAKQEVIQKLEAILKKEPDHLNALADLERVYRQNCRYADADECMWKKQKILKSSDQTHTRCKAICLLEQGYASAFEEVDRFNIGFAYNKTKEVSKLLHNEYRKGCYGEGKETLKKSLDCSKNLCSDLEDLVERQYDEVISAKCEIAIQLLKKGLQLLQSIDHDPSEIIKWQFYLARAYSRIKIQSTLKQTEFREHANCNSIELFLKIVKYFKSEKAEEQNKFYIARSYAYMGYILMSKKPLINKHCNEFSFKDDSEYLELLSDPLKACKASVSICPDDIIALNRYAMSLLYKSKYIDTSKREERLRYADTLISKSIASSPESNWGAYSTRIKLLHFWTTISKIKGKGNDKMKKQQMKRALEDGRKCFETKLTEGDCVIIAQICQNLSKFPQHVRFGPKFVKHKSYLHEALTFLNHGLSLQGRMDYHLAYTIGSCLYDLQDYRYAIIWMERAMYLSRRDSLQSSLRNVCLYLCTLYESLTTKGDKNENRYLLEELLFVLQAGMKRSTDKTIIKKISKYLSKHRRLQLLNFIEFVYDSRYVKNSKYLNIAHEMLGYLPTKQKKRLAEMSSKTGTDGKDVDDECVVNLKSTFQRSSTALPQNESRKQNRYDFFISHSSNDSGWVKTNLLRQLETPFHVQDRSLRGCFDDRDFEEGKSVFDNILHAIHNSKKILLLLSPSFVHSNWCSYEADKSIMKSLNQGNKDDASVIPVMVEACEVPEKLNHLNILDLTEEPILNKIRKLQHQISYDC